ncbi:MAG: U32 family peptidase [Candidatus Woesearchaeota archaeon]
MVQILAPVGSFAALKASIQSGADAIYFGVGQLQMRSKTASFQREDMSKICQICHDAQVKAYLVVNTIVFDQEQEEIHQLLMHAKKTGVDAIIAHDFAVIQKARAFKLPIHISTQANITNIESVKFYAQFADCVVLARELTLSQIAYICERIKKEHILGVSGKLLQVEIFVHGALCVAFSGKCYMSLHTQNSSANRGHCYQTCRKAYTLSDENQAYIQVDNPYILSPKDLCTIPILDRIVESGVTLLKIEGRGKSPEYVKTTVSVYKRAIEHIREKTYSEDVKEKLINELQTVYNRDFWMNGYYLGEPIAQWSKKVNSQATEKKVFSGKVIDYFAQKQIAHIKIQSSKVQKGDEIYVIGPTTGVIRQRIDEIQNHPENEITTPFSTKVRKNDEVYLIEKVSTK